MSKESLLHKMTHKEEEPVERREADSLTTKAEDGLRQDVEATVRAIGELTKRITVLEAKVQVLEDARVR